MSHDLPDADSTRVDFPDKDHSCAAVPNAETGHRLSMKSFHSQRDNVNSVFGAKAKSNFERRLSQRPTVTQYLEWDYARLTTLLQYLG